MANSDQQPWQPDPAKGAGESGERGTAAFDGNAAWDYQGRPIGTNPAAGPRLGKDYAVANGTDTVTTVAARGITAAIVERAGTHAAVTSVCTLTASTTAPAANAAVLFTGTITSAQTWPFSGTVTFKEGAATLGTGTVNASGVATYNHAAGFATGAHSITAEYGGSAEYAADTSDVLVVTASA